MAVKSVFRKGAKAAGGGGDSGVYVRAKEDEALTFVPLHELDQMLSVDQHEYWDTNPAVIFPCIGQATCPACKSGNKAKYKGFMSVMANGEAVAKILPFGLSIERQLVEIASELGSIKGSVFKLRRTGSGLSTKYTVVAIGKKVDVSTVEALNIEDHINVLTAAEIKAKISFLGGETEEAEPEAKTAVKEDAGGWETVD